MFRFTLVLALLLALVPLLDAKCGGGGGASRGRLFGRFAERRAERRATSSMTMTTYSSRGTYMMVPMLRAAPANQSCAPQQAPPMKK